MREPEAQPKDDDAAQLRLATDENFALPLSIRNTAHVFRERSICLHLAADGTKDGIVAVAQRGSGEEQAT